MNLHQIVLPLPLDAVDKIIFHHRLEHKLDNGQGQKLCRAFHLRPETPLIAVLEQFQILLAVVQLLPQGDHIGLL